MWCARGATSASGGSRTAVAAFGHPVEVVWRSYENSTAVRHRYGRGRRLSASRKYGMTVEEASAQHRRITDLAAAEGLDYHLERARSGRSFDAHRLLHLARDRGVQDAVKERLLAGYLQEGVAIGLPEELGPLAVSAGLEQGDVDAVLAGDAFGDAVRADEERAMELGITGVPFFVIGGRFAIPGAQDPETILTVLQRAWDRQVPVVVTGSGSRRHLRGRRLRDLMRA